MAAPFPPPAKRTDQSTCAGAAANHRGGAFTFTFFGTCDRGSLNRPLPAAYCD